MASRSRSVDYRRGFHVWGARGATLLGQSIRLVGCDAMINQVFLLGPQPAPDDTRPRNGFGVLLAFGQAYAAYYDELDRQAELRRRQANKRRRQARGRTAAMIDGRQGSPRKPAPRRTANRPTGRTRRQGSPRKPAPRRTANRPNSAPGLAPGSLRPDQHRKASTAPTTVTTRTHPAAPDPGRRFNRASGVCGLFPNFKI